MSGASKQCLLRRPDVVLLVPKAPLPVRGDPPGALGVATSRSAPRRFLATADLISDDLARVPDAGEKPPEEWRWIFEQYDRLRELERPGSWTRCGG